MPIQHVVAFKYKPSASPAQLAQISEAFLALKTQCKPQEAKGGESYIVKLVGGKQDSKEGADQGVHQVFLVEFKNDEDRTWYVDEDPAHDAFKNLVGPLVESAVVLDFTEGVF